MFLRASVWFSSNRCDKKAWWNVFTARYGLISYIKKITLSVLQLRPQWHHIAIHVAVATWPLAKPFPRVAHDVPSCVTDSPCGRERLTVSCAQSAVLVQHSALQEAQHREIIRSLIMYTLYWGAPAREDIPHSPTEGHLPRYLLTRFPLSLIHPNPPPILKRFPSHTKKLLLLICVAVFSEASLLCIYNIYGIIQGDKKVSVPLFIIYYFLWLCSPARAMAS
jgi:hypothetical protein